jgi:hypothetical protein
MKSLLSLLIMLIAAAGCKNHTPKVTAEQKAVEKGMDTIQSKAEETLKRYSSYPEDSLPELLHIDSRKMVEPFNSLAYKELLKRKTVDIQKLVQSVNTADYTSLLNLLAVRKLNEQAYKQIPDSQKLSILVDALSKSKTFNTWGFPHLRMEDASLAIIEIGEYAIPRLKPLLNDCRNALLWGDEEYYEYQKYKYRLCDFAMIFIKRINKEQFTIPESPEERDKMIARIK